MTEVKLTRVPVSNVVPVVRNPVVNTQYEQDSDYDDDDDYDIDIQTISSSKVVIKRTLKVIMVYILVIILIGNFVPIHICSICILQLP